MISGCSERLHLGPIKAEFLALVARIACPEVVRKVFIYQVSDRKYQSFGPRAGSWAKIPLLGRLRSYSVSGIFRALENRAPGVALRFGS